MTTTPSIETVSSKSRIASTAAPSAPSLSPRPIQRAHASAAYSVVLTNSMARLRSGLGLASMGWEPNLDDARRLAVGRVERLAQVARREQPERGEQRHEVANPKADVDAVAGPPQDDPVAKDQHEGDDPDDHRHLA